jgi:hypothetical protein
LKSISGSWTQLTGCSEQRLRIDRHLELCSAQDKELGPRFLQETALIPARQTEEGRDALHPLDGHEEDPCSRLADRLRVVEVGAEDFVRVLEEEEEDESMGVKDRVWTVHIFTMQRAIVLMSKILFKPINIRV